MPTTPQILAKIRLDPSSIPADAKIVQAIIESNLKGLSAGKAGASGSSLSAVAAARSNALKVAEGVGDSPIAVAVRRRQEIERLQGRRGSGDQDGSVLGTALYRIGKSPQGTDSYLEAIARIAPKAAVALGAVKAVSAAVKGLNIASDIAFYRAKGDVEKVDELFSRIEEAWRKFPILGDAREAARGFFEADERRAVEQIEKDIEKQKEHIEKMKAANAEAAGARKRETRRQRAEQTDLLNFQREVQRRVLEGEMKTAADVLKVTKDLHRKRAATATPTTPARTSPRPTAPADLIDRAKRDNARQAADLADMQRRRRTPIERLNKALDESVPPDREGGRKQYERVGGLSTVAETLRKTREDIKRGRLSPLSDLEGPENHRLHDQQQKRLEAAQRRMDEVNAALGGGNIVRRVSTSPYITDLTPNSKVGDRPEFVITKEQGDKIITSLDKLNEQFRDARNKVAVLGR